MGIKARRRARRVAREFSGSGSWNPSDSHGEDVARFFESVLRRDARAFGGDDGTHRARATSRERRRRKGGSMDWLLRVLTAILVSFADVLGGVFARVTPTRAQYASRRVLRDDAPEDDIFRRGFRAGPRGNCERADERPTPPAPPTSRSADPFRALGLEREGATPDDVARAYRALAFRWHPDKNGQSDESHAAMQTINAARAACLSILRGVEGTTRTTRTTPVRTPPETRTRTMTKSVPLVARRHESRRRTRARSEENARAYAPRGHTPDEDSDAKPPSTTPRRTRIGDVEASIAIAFLAMAILIATPITILPVAPAPPVADPPSIAIWIGWTPRRARWHAPRGRARVWFSSSSSCTVSRRFWRLTRTETRRCITRRGTIQAWWTR